MSEINGEKHAFIEEPIKSASVCQILKLPKATLIDEETEEDG